MSSMRLLILVIFYFTSVLCKNKICDFEDDKCITAGANRKFAGFIAGTKGWEPSDPIHLDSIEADLTTSKYKAFNSSLIGMKNCQVDLLRITIKGLFYYYIGCPELTVETGYEAKGVLGTEYVEGKGTCKVDLYDYHFLIHGNYEKLNDENGKLHLHVKNHVLEVEARGKVHYDCKNLFNGDKEKSDALNKFANENWQLVGKMIRQPIMEGFMNKFMDNINGCLKVIPFEGLFFYK